MMNDRLSSIMTPNVVTVNPDDTLATVKDILFSRGFHHVPVVEGTKLCGIITSYDMVRLDLPFAEYKNIIVKDVMTKKVVTLTPNELIGAAAQIFLKHLFHGLPIVNDDGDLVGIVTTHDILKYEFLKEYPDDIFVKKTKWMESVSH
jgi:CBS domain-containing protein